MHLIQDGHAAVIADSYADAEALLLPHLTPSDGEARVVVRLVLDGHEVPANALDDLSAVSLAGCERVEVETAPVREVARKSLVSAGEYAERVQEALCHTAELLRSERPEVANEYFAEAIDGMSVLLFTLQAAAEQLGPVARSVEEIGTRVQPWLDALAEAQLAQDWIRMADYLEYEIAPVLGEARGTIASLFAS